MLCRAGLQSLGDEASPGGKIRAWVRSSPYKSQQTQVKAFVSLFTRPRCILGSPWGTFGCWGRQNCGFSNQEQRGTLTFSHKLQPRSCYALRSRSGGCLSHELTPGMGREQVALSHTDGCGMGSSQPTLNPPLAKTTRDPRRTTAQGKESGKFSPKVIFFNFFFT